MGRHAVYIELAGRIQAEIAPFQNGWLLDPVRNYARHHGVSPSTVRKAFALLAAQGMIECRENGQYVRTHATGWRNHPRKYPVVGLLTSTGPQLSEDGYISRLLRSFSNGVHERGVPVCLFPNARYLAARPVAGGLALGPTQIGCSAVALLFGAEESRLAELVEHGLVVMALDCLSGTEGVDSVAVDCEDEAAQAVRHLADLGHRHIAFIGQGLIRHPNHWKDGTDPDVWRFHTGILAAKQALDLNTSPDYHAFCRRDSFGSDVTLRHTLQRLLRLQPPPTAFVLFDTDVALQTKALLQEWSIRCPAQVSIIARGMSDSAGGVTRLASDPLRIGSTAAAHIVQRLDNPHCAATRLLFRSTLVEGSTTAKAPSAGRQ